MNDFTAFNNTVIEVHADGLLVAIEPAFKNPHSTHPLIVDALREFFEAEADKHLGRWRWPEHPEYVVYAPRDFTHYVRVLDESGAMWDVVYREGVEDRGSLTAQAARAYFDAHPEPKPWHDAKPGEGWVIDIGSADFPNPQAVVVSNGGKFLLRDGGSIPVDRQYIRSGRRTHPEVSP